MIANTKIIELPAFKDAKYGSLVAVETMRTIPFEVRRVYYIYDVPQGERRGFHSHNELEQVLICVNGSVMIHVSALYDSEEILLDSPEKGLYIGPMIWREMYDFSQGAVLLVLASEHFDEADYLRDRDVYMERAKRYFV
jgi:dTDP-4-dehydrorhamnose 3,5-epimerase-like enzyme